MKINFRNIMVGAVSLTMIIGSIYLATRNPSVDGWGWVCFGGIFVLSALETEEE
jgi:hypothetical protein